MWVGGWGKAGRVRGQGFGRMDGSVEGMGTMGGERDMCVCVCVRWPTRSVLSKSMRESVKGSMPYRRRTSGMRCRGTPIATCTTHDVSISHGGQCMWVGMARRPKWLDPASLAGGVDVGVGSGGGGGGGWVAYLQLRGRQVDVGDHLRHGVLHLCGGHGRDEQDVVTRKAFGSSWSRAWGGGSTRQDKVDDFVCV